MRHWDYDQYLEILGYEAAPYLRKGETPPAVAATRDLFLVVTRPLQGEARELCSKMLQALKLSSSQLQHVELEAPSIAALDETSRKRARLCLAMGFDVAGGLLEAAASPHLRGAGHRSSSWNEVAIYATYSPADCIADASLKRPVWDDLQALLKVF